MLQVAKHGSESAKNDADIQALFILMVCACGVGSEMQKQLASAHLHLLQADPFCCSAIAGEGPQHHICFWCQTSLGLKSQRCAKR